MNDPLTVLEDGRGRPVATYHATERRGRPCADGLATAPGADDDAVVAAVLEQFGGWSVATSPQLAERLIAAGATELRRAILMLHELGPQAPPPALRGAVTIAPYAHASHDVIPALLAAYPPGHHDREAGSSDADERASMERLLGGHVAGPVMAASRVGLDRNGRVVAAAIVNAEVPEPPFTGPWLGEVFRHPDAAPPGTGAALIAAVVAALREDGERALGLMVTAANPARQVYERLGFDVVRTAVTVLVPGSAADATRPEGR